MTATHVSDDRLDWRRVGALSTAFNLHVVAAGALLLVATAPAPPDLLRPVTAPIVEAYIVEPEPIPPPEVPVVELQPAPTTVPVELPPTQTPAPIIDAQPLAAVAVPVPQPMPIQAPVAGISRVSSTAAVSDRGVAYQQVVQPTYPDSARRRGATGEATLRILVASDGQVQQIELARSSGHRDLDRAAVAAVRTWQFQPAIEAGRPITAWVLVPVAFSLTRN